MDASKAHETREDVTFLDVREPYEWKGGHIRGSRNVPLGDIPALVDDLRSDVPIVTVCTVGARSDEAARFLRSFGIVAENLDGGVVAWSEKGFELVTPDGDPGRVVK